MTKPLNVICLFCREPAIFWPDTKDHPAGCRREVEALVGMRAQIDQR